MIASTNMAWRPGDACDRNKPHSFGRIAPVQYDDGGEAEYYQWCHNIPKLALGRLNGTLPLWVWRRWRWDTEGKIFDRIMDAVLEKADGGMSLFEVHLIYNFVSASAWLDNLHDRTCYHIRKVQI